MRLIDESHKKLTCLQCGKSWGRRYDQDPRNCHFCKSKRWNKEGPGRNILYGRFLGILMSLIAQETDQCIEWPFARVTDNYGTIALNNKSYRTTHVSWEIANKLPVPEGKKVCHSCDNPPCINPRHLFVATQLKNMQDCKEKNRLARGEHHGLAKLTEEAVREIRRAVGKTDVELSKQFNVARTTINAIRIGKTWTHVA